jgi:hypothetical protein
MRMSKIFNKDWNHPLHYSGHLKNSVSESVPVIFIEQDLYMLNPNTGLLLTKKWYAHPRIGHCRNSK